MPNYGNVDGVYFTNRTLNTHEKCGYRSISYYRENTLVNRIPTDLVTNPACGTWL